MVDKTGCAELPQLRRWTSMFIDCLDQWRLWDLSNADETILNLVHDLIAKIKVKGSLVRERIELLERLENVNVRMMLTYGFDTERRRQNI